MKTLENNLVKLARTLSDNGIPYMIIGGMANAVWGEPRATLDIDATIWVNDAEVERFISTVESEFRCLVSNPLDFIRNTRVLPLESEDTVRIDLIFGTLPYEKQAIERAVTLAVAGPYSLRPLPSHILIGDSSKIGRCYQSIDRVARRFRQKYGVCH